MCLLDYEHDDNWANTKTHILVQLLFQTRECDNVTSEHENIQTYLRTRVGDISTTSVDTVHIFTRIKSTWIQSSWLQVILIFNPVTCKEVSITF